MGARAHERTVTWGEGLQVKAINNRPGGLKAIVAEIQEVAGVTIGSRQSFRDLFAFRDPADLNPRQRQRAAYLLLAMDEKLEDWGLSEADIPIRSNIDWSRDQAGRTSRWMAVLAGLAA